MANTFNKKNYKCRQTLFGYFRWGTVDKLHSSQTTPTCTEDEEMAISMRMTLVKMPSSYAGKIAGTHIHVHTAVAMQVFTWTNKSLLPHNSQKRQTLQPASRGPIQGGDVERHGSQRQPVASPAVWRLAAGALDTGAQGER